MKVGIIISIVIAIAVVVVALVPLKEVAYTVAVDYEATETYYENEPYQVTENYTKAIPLSFEARGYVKKDVIFERRQIIIGGIVFQDEIVAVPIYRASVEVKNTDDVAGNFTVSFSGFEPIFGKRSLTQTVSLAPNQQKTVSCPSESIIVNWNYRVTPGTKEVQRERTVTRYREVERERTVIRQRQETRYKRVTLLDYLLHY
jgi:hypothetical protein